MTESHSQIKTSSSLRFQYIVIAVVVVSVFVLSSILASFYFKSATEKNTALLNLHDTIIVHVDDLRNSIWKADKSLYELLSDSEKVHQEKIKSRFNIVAGKLKIISELNGVENTGLLINVYSLINAHEKLNAEVNILLELRKDINWLYPMLHFIDTTLLESNNDFETALNHAIKETFDSGDKKYFGKVYRHLDDLRNIWRLKILDFRGSLIMYAGLNTKNNAQIKNIQNYQQLIEKKLQGLADIAKTGGLGFEAELALDVMRNSSKQWNKDYNKLLEIRKSNLWRSDIYYIRTKIQPLQKNVFDELGLMEKSLNLWSTQNTKHVDDAAKKINIELWFLTSVAILFVILIYFFKVSIYVKWHMLFPDHIIPILNSIGKKSIFIVERIKGFLIFYNNTLFFK